VDRNELREETIDADVRIGYDPPSANFVMNSLVRSSDTYGVGLDVHTAAERKSTLVSKELGRRDAVFRA
jgi:hypothetical protein